MTVEISPSVFEQVFFDVAEIADVFEEARLAVSGLPLDLDVSITVNEKVPNTRVAITTLDPVVFYVESGALEDTKVPRTFSADAAMATFCRLHLELRDRLDDTFGAPALDEEISQADAVSWAVYCYGRATRIGAKVFKPRYRYDFRNRHGFSDATDANYELLWSSDALTWDQIRAMSAE
ncbi:MAG: hypothetical protein ACI8TP_002274 [Acidimicrobiales bacterium]